VRGEGVQPVAMAGVQRVQAGVEAGERVAMGRQDEQVIGQPAQLGDGGQPVAQRIAFRLAERQ
jgi:hypothetical protein